MCAAFSPTGIQGFDSSPATHVIGVAVVKRRLRGDALVMDVGTWSNTDIQLHVRTKNDRLDYLTALE